jgi:hypothetical protein
MFNPCGPCRIAKTCQYPKKMWEYYMAQGLYLADFERLKKEA